MKNGENTTIPDLSAAMDKAVHCETFGNLEIDLEHYQAYLDDPSLTQAQKAEIVRALWSIITAFVELGFGVHPVQQACGKLGTELDRGEKSESTGLVQGKQQKDIDAPAI
ncbi:MULTISPECIES: hypothetical protein [Actibacterium]|uniref:Uncharacterized protein n=1 Tax=Actibacterium naphthalenivorans TaxID=1614693 RepID=A0A840CAU0_9RHOB|nr:MULTISPECIES: hypothetical protein [Actibacterium]MBB4022515.1 hypothetical protein [Actibacterium naphthalenivorans]